VISLESKYALNFHGNQARETFGSMQLTINTEETGSKLGVQSATAGSSARTEAVTFSGSTFLGGTHRCSAGKR
jgi:hypothetical protein